MKFSKDISSVVLNNYFGLALGIYILAMLIPKFRPGVCITLILIFLMVNLVLKKRFEKISKTDFWVIVYIIYNIVSYTWIDVDGFGFSEFLGEVAVSIFPIIVYFCAKKIKNWDIFYEHTLNAIIICILIGAVLYITMPAFYRAYLYKYGFAASDLAVHARQGFSSYIGRTAMGTFSVYGMAISLHMLLLENHPKKHAVYMFICLSACILSSMRSAWIGGFIIFFIGIYKIMKKTKFRIPKWSILIILIGIVVIIKVFSGGNAAGAQITEKILELNIKDAIGSRSYTWIKGIKSMNHYILGNGLGTAGHKAHGLVLNSVTDGGLVKMFMEIGILGCAIFLFMLRDLYIGLINKKITIDMAMVLFIIFQCTGSNILSLQITCAIFWISLGAISINRTNH